MAEATNTLSTSSLQRETVPGSTPRRDLLGTLAAAGAATISGTATAAEVDPHLAWEREVAEIWERDLPDEEEGAWIDEWCTVVDRIAMTPARTPAGIATQIRLAIRSDAGGSTLSEADVRGLENAVAALERMAREG